MLPNDKKQMSREERIEVAEIAEMARRLPEREKERFFYMMKGVALMGEAEHSQPAQKAVGA